MYLCMYEHTYACIVCTHAYLHVCVCVCLYVCISMYACMQLHIYMHAQSWRNSIFAIFQLPSQSQLNSYLKSSTKLTIPSKFGRTVQLIIKTYLFYARNCFICLHSSQNLNTNLTLLTDFPEKRTRGNFASRQYISLSNVSAITNSAVHFFRVLSLDLPAGCITKYY